MLKFVINPATKIFLILRVIAVAIPVCLLLELLKKKKDRNFISLIVKTKTLIVNSSKAASPQMLA